MEATLEAVKRETRGKNAARRLRRDGMIPAVMYGAEEAARSEGVALAVDPKLLSRILHSESGVNTIIDLQLPDGATDRVLVKHYLLDPVSHHLLHADFYRFAADKLITVTVSVLVRGEAKGIKQEGGLLEFVHREVVVECLPADIPEHIELDVSELMIGDSIRLREVAEGQTWTSVTDLDTMLVHLVAPRVEEEPVDEEASEEVAVDGQSEPEVIKKGKADETDEEK
jgi:large subunit ribosomal protein L25